MRRRELLVTLAGSSSVVAGCNGATPSPPTSGRDRRSATTAATQMQRTTPAPTATPEHPTASTTTRETTLESSPETTSETPSGRDERVQLEPGRIVERTATVHSDDWAVSLAGADSMLAIRFGDRFRQLAAGSKLVVVEHTVRNDLWYARSWWDLYLTFVHDGRIVRPVSRLGGEDVAGVDSDHDVSVANLPGVEHASQFGLEGFRIDPGGEAAVYSVAVFDRDVPLTEIEIGVDTRGLGPRRYQFRWRLG